MATTTLTRDERRRRFTDPIAFAEKILGHDTWDTQRRILRSVATNPRTAVKACHASSKTFTAAEATLWWISAHKDGVVVTTAPTWGQVKNVLWPEIHKAASGAKVDYPEPNQTELRMGPGRYAMGLSTNEGIRFQGFHGKMLIVMDEAPGIDPAIYEAVEGIRAGGDVRILALGNPTVASGPFHDAFASNREGWASFTVSAFETPNLEGVSLERLLSMGDEELDDNPRPYLVTRRWVAEKYHEWGPGHPLWESRVAGRFPEQSEDALISLGWLEAAKLREPVFDPALPIAAGLDVAGPGENETVLVVRQGPSVLLQKAWTKPDPRGDVVDALRPWAKERPFVNVDSVGIGYYMAQTLRDAGFLRVREVNVGATPRDKERYADLKAEAYWGLRMRAEAGDLAGLADEATIGQLAGIRYGHDARGRVVVEPKEKARKRGVKSPDRAEATMLAFYESGHVERQVADAGFAAAPTFGDEPPWGGAWSWDDLPGDF